MKKILKLENELKQLDSNLGLINKKYNVNLENTSITSIIV